VRRVSLLLAVALTAGACGNAAVVREAEPFEGRWKSEGFGTYLVIEEGEIRIYETTDISCVRVVSGSARGVSDVLSFEGKRLVLDDTGRIVKYDKVDAVPEACGRAWGSDDPQRAFDVLMANIEDHYVFFSDVGDTWPAMRQAADDRVDSTTTDAELAAVITDVLSSLRGRQLRLAVDDVELLPPDGTWPAGVGNQAADLLAADQAAGVRLQEGWVIEGQDGIVSGVTTAGIPYMAIRQLAAFDDEQGESPRILAGIIDAWLGMAQDLDAPGVILDLRANPGGQDINALLIASRFVPDERVVLTREVRVEGTDRFVPAGSATVRPTIQGPYDGEVVVLIGPGTAGSAEVLALAVRDLPGVTLMGERTSGSLAPILVRALPNGWAVGLPNERVSDIDGIEWEGIGLEPEVGVTLTIADLESGADPGLATAEALLGG